MPAETQTKVVLRDVTPESKYHTYKSTDINGDNIFVF